MAYVDMSAMGDKKDPQAEDESMKKECQEYCDRQARMETKRSNWMSHWQECMDYIVPRKEDVLSKRFEGDKRGAELFDSTAIMANALLAGALHSMLTNPTTRFFELTTGDAKLDQLDEVQSWLQDTAEKMYQVFNNSNFQTEIHEVYIDLGAIGTAALFIGEHDKNVVHFSARPMKEVFVLENNQGLIDIVHRKFQWKPRQVVQEFGIKNLPAWVVDQYEKGCDDDWNILHVVEPAHEDDPKFHGFKSCYLLVDQKIMLAKKGFNEFPFAVPRWTKTSGEIYGRGPGMDSLPDTKMANAMMETVIKGAQKTVDPPLMVTDDGVIGRVRLTPGGLTVVRQTNGDPPIRPLITDARIDFGQKMVEDVRSRIRSAFYVDQLQLQNNDRMTTVEVQRRQEDMLRLMGPILGRQHFEFLRPVVERVFGIMHRKGLIDDAPQIIQGRNVDARYSSLVARAQRMNEGDNLGRAMQIAAPFVQSDPTVLDNLDGDAALRYVMGIYGVPHLLLRSTRDIKAKREQRAQAQQQAMQQQQQQHQAEVVQKAGPTMAQMQQIQQQGKQGA